MKFCNAIPVYTAQQRPMRTGLATRGPGSQLCNEISQMQSLCTSPDFYWHSRSLEGFSDGSVGKESAWSLDVPSQKKKSTLKMTTRPGDFSFAVISLKGNTLLWNWKLSLHFDLFSSVWIGTEVEGGGLWSPHHYPASIFAWKGRRTPPSKHADAWFPLREIFLLHPLRPPHRLHTHLTHQVSTFLSLNP